MSEPARRRSHEQEAGAPGVAEALPVLGIPAVPDAMTLWTRALVAASVLAGLFLLDRLTLVLMDLWLLRSLGQEEIFWTNFRAGAVLFTLGFAGTAIGLARPTFTTAMPAGWRRLVRLVALLGGLVAAWLLAGSYLEFLGFLSWQRFGQLDPVFGRDIGYFVFVLPVLWLIWTAVTVPLAFGLASSALCASVAEPAGKPDRALGRLALALGRTSTPGTLVNVGALGVALAVGVWLSRYDLLWKDNRNSGIFAGAEYVDVVGLFSFLNYYYVTALVVLGVTAATVLGLRQLRRAAVGATSAEATYRGLRSAGFAALAFVVLDFSFAGLVSLRDLVVASPNEPVIQLPFIERHIQATLDGYDLKDVEVGSFVPYGEDDPIPDAKTLLASPTLRNVPLWPGFSNYLERVVDAQHANRVLVTGGDPMIYGPTLEILRQQQKLRTYYDFMNVDTVRYEIDGEKRVFVSAARELPLSVPRPSLPQQWLQFWGQRFLLFTHGYGLVMAPAAAVSPDGTPVYASFGIPPQTTRPELMPGNQAIYYGEGATRIGFSNAQGIKELDFPSEEGRVEVEVEPTDHGGVTVDSALKRLVVGWRAGHTFDIWFSDLIGPETRVHYERTPLERAARVAPFLYYDTNQYAVATEDGILWFVNALSTTDRFPYSAMKDLGDKATERAVHPRPIRWVNWVRDSVKVTVDARSGEVTFYQISDDPVTETWASVYPSLFRPGDEMPQSVRKHLQYPQHLLHSQFDDVYKRYHMTEPMEFFNMEDLWDDGDEVLGPIIGSGEAITFSNEPHHWLAETKGPLPASDDGTQFVLSMYFANERANNLRAMVFAYQDGEDYGRLVDVRVPKGLFYPSAEQADSAIDQDPEISKHITWWNRMGSEVIHGHTNALLIDREVLYVAPIFLRSRQNQLTQIKQVAVVFRGHPAAAGTLEEALTLAIDKARAAQARRAETAQTASAP